MKQSYSRQRLVKGWRVLVASAMTSALVAYVPASMAQTFTLDAGFDSGVLTNVNHDAPNNDQLQLNDTTSTFPLLWIANAGEDTVSKIDTDADCETARYETWFFGNHLGNAFVGPAPSRTAVDGDGNVYVANRHFDGKPASVMKILAEGGIERNGIPGIQTSVDDGDCQIDRNDPAELIRLLDNNPANGILDDAELLDERVAWVVQVGGNNGLGRSLCIAPNGNIWLGLFNSREYYELDSSTGNVLQGPIGAVVSAYGCLIDNNGILYSADLGTNLGILDTNVPTTTSTPSHAAQGSNYGIALGDGKVYLANRSFRSYTEYDVATNTFSTPAAVFQETFGISVDGNGDIVLGRDFIRKFDPSDGSVIWGVANPAGSSDQRGVIVDSDNNIWVVNKNSNNVTKFRGTDGTFLGTVPVGNQPYTYSDATGLSFISTNPQGRWDLTVDGGGPGTAWDSITFNSEPEGSIPAGTSITVEARAADVEADLPLQPFTSVTNGAPGLGLTGQFIGIRASLAGDGQASPVLSDLTVAKLSTALRCDIDGNDVVDINDIRAIMAARNTPAAPGDPRDNDGDGLITANDARQCVLLCTNSRCAPG